MRWVLRLLVAVFVWQICCELPGAQERDLPAKTPFPRVDAGMHHAVIRGLSTDTGCTALATGSDDKTIRLWSTSDNRLIKTLRPPIGDGDEGKINSVALAPNGRWLAAGGWTRTGGEHWVYIFDTETGQITARLGPSSTIQHVAVSPDGKRVAAALSRGHGLRVWERPDDSIASWTLIVDDANFQGQTATYVVFANPDALYVTAIGSTSTGNGSLRRYNLAQSNRAIRTRVTTGGRRPASVAISPDGQRVAVGFNDTSAIDIYEAGPLAPLPQLNRGTVTSGSLNAVTWSHDGKSLIAAGSYSIGGQVMIRIWGDDGRAAPRDLSGPSDAIFELVPCGDRIAFASADPSIGFISRDGSVNVIHGPVGADMRGKQGASFTLSPDGYRVRFGLKEGIGHPVLFDLSSGRLIESPEPLLDLAVADSSSLPVTVNPNAFTARLSGRLLQVDDGERARSLAIDPGGRGFALGTDNYLRFYDQAGSQMWRTQAPGAIWGVNAVKQRPVIVAACGDGTIRWYNIEGRELVALFVHAESKRWIAWTPSGYYMASAGGEELMGWHVNRGWAETGDFFTAARFRPQFYRPDIVLKVLATLDEDLAIKAANREIDHPARSIGLRDDLPPVVRIQSPIPNSFVHSLSAEIEFTVRSPSSQPISRISAKIDGRPAAPPITLDTRTRTDGEYVGHFTIQLPPRPIIDISIIAETGSTSSQPESIRIFRPPP